MSGLWSIRANGEFPVNGRIRSEAEFGRSKVYVRSVRAADTAMRSEFQLMPNAAVTLKIQTTPARSSIACNNTLHPAVMCSGFASSISLWLMPSLQGIKIMPLGASLAM